MKIHPSLWHPKCPCSLHDSPALPPTLRHKSAYYSVIYFNLLSHVCIALPSNLFQSGLPNKITNKLLTCLITYRPSHAIHLALFTLITFCEGNKSWRSWLWNCLNPLLALHHLRLNIFSSALCYKTQCIYISLFIPTTARKFYIFILYAPTCFGWHSQPSSRSYFL